ncbi:MAG: T9SS type A sorting domain-containing protein [Bacteroidales bacterium]|nr:T9SS type A sorting domain-containing protein [Bacteroidales bacterium]
MRHLHFFRSALQMLLISILIVLPLRVNAQAPWSVNPADYEFNGSIEAIVILDGAEVVSGYLGAFVGDECRGVSDTISFPTGKKGFSLMCFSNQPSGEMLSFKYYDPGTDTEYSIQETIEFVAEMRGNAIYPEILHAGTNSAPVAACPDKSTLAPAPGPITFDLCAIFSDPDGDALTYDAVASDGAVLNRTSACDLEVTTAASGTTTLTLSATDGEFTATCEYSFTVTANNAPLVDAPLGMRLEDEGFGSLQIDLGSVFSDPDGDALTYSAVPGNTGIVTATVSSATLTITEVAAGNTTVTVTASDGEFSVQDIITIVVVASVPAPPWSVTASDFSYSGQIEAVVLVNDVEVNTGTLAAFVGDECRGVAVGSYFAFNGKTIFSLQVFSNSTSGDMLTFRYYDPVNQEVQVIDEVIPFTSNMTMGSAGLPTLLHITSVNNLPLLVNALSDQEVNEHFGTLVLEAGAVFSDPDSDVLSYTASVANTSVATVQLSGSTLTITEGGTGTTTVEVYASDGEFSTVDRFVLKVNEVNDPPVVAVSIPDQSLQEGFGTQHIAISGTFTDPEGGVLSYSASSGDEAVVTVSLSGGNLVLTETGTGTAQVSVCVNDGEFQVCDQFSVTVEALNESPVLAVALSDQLLQAGFGTHRISFSGTFSDPDGDALTYRVSSGNEQVVTVSIDGIDLVITEAGNGTATIIVCASDGALEVCDQFNVVVQAGNHSPEADCPDGLNAIFIEGFGSYVPAGLCAAFSDPDGDALTYTVTSSDPGVVSVSGEGCEVTVTEAGPGTATVTVCASDGEFEVCCSFTVAIVAENVLTVFLGTEELVEGDSVQHCSETVTVTLTVNSSIPWSITASADWFTAELVDASHAEIVFSENTTGSERSGSIAVRDTQDHVINLVVYQSATCIPDGIGTDALQGYRVYPNPVQDMVNIVLPASVPGSGEVVLRLYAADGRMLRSVTDVVGPGMLLTFDMQDYRPGIYYLVIEEAGGKRVRVPLVR